MSDVNENEILEKVLKGDIKLYRIEELVGNDVNRAARIRRLFLEKVTGAKLEHIGKHSWDLNITWRRNIENAIGVAQVPMGIVGPLKINGEYAKGEFYVPLCTSEGALVASVNRGCRAITLSGGAKARIIRDYMTRAPVFETPSIEKALELVSWVKEHYDEIKKVFEATEKHGFLKLLDIKPWILGKYVWLRFEAYTFDAMGMNMVTKGADAAGRYIEKETGYAKMISLSGNLCTDKKPGAINWLLGRGKTVTAEAILKRDVVKEVLKTTPEAMHKVNIVKNWLGSGYAHAYGLNAHVANIIAAIFIATGQDVAQVVESSMAITVTDVTEDGDLYISVTLPSLEVATVGGGTHLPYAREALSIMGCSGPGNPPGSNVKKFAEIVACTALAGEISLIAALAAGHLAIAHERLGRPRGKQKW